MCDGIPDVMRNEEAVFELDFVRDEANPTKDVKEACGKLVQEAYKRGSQDNLTVVLVRFQWEVLPKPKEVSREVPKAAPKEVPKESQAKPSDAATDVPLPGESAVDALKRKHEEQRKKEETVLESVEPAESSEPPAKAQKVDSASPGDKSL